MLYSGPADSSISEWIDEHQVGLSARGLDLDKLAHRLAELASNLGEVQAMQRRAFTTYQRHFSKQAVMDRWDSLLSDELARLHGGAALGAQPADPDPSPAGLSSARRRCPGSVP